jgi:hypothetical protein
VLFIHVAGHFFVEKFRKNFEAPAKGEVEIDGSVWRRHGEISL